MIILYQFSNAIVHAQCCFKVSKRKSYTVQDKLEAITRVKQCCETQASVSRNNNIPESILHGWIRDEHKMCDFSDIVNSNDGTKRKKARTAGDRDLDRTVYSWFVKVRQVGTPISGPLMAVQPQKFHKQLHVDNHVEFTASKGSLNRFKQHNGISQFKITGEVRSIDFAAADAFTPILQMYILDNDLLPEQIYNADETVLYYKMIQDKTLPIKTDKHKHEGFK